MKIITDDDKTIVFLNDKQYIKFNENDMESYFKSLFTVLEDKYNLDINSYNDVCVYKDINYGIILEFKCNEIDYFFDNIDMKINIFKTHYFLYEIAYEYLDKVILNNCILFKNKDKFYLKIEKEIDELFFSKILEYSDIIYGEKVIELEKVGRKVDYAKKCSSFSG